MPNFAKSEFLTVTSLFPGSLMTEVKVSVFTTEEPGANASYNPSRIFLDRFVRGLVLASFTSNEASVRGTDCPTSGWGITLDSLFRSSFFRFSVSLLPSLSEFSSEMSSYHLTVSKSILTQGLHFAVFVIMSLCIYGHHA